MIKLVKIDMQPLRDLNDNSDLSSIYISSDLKELKGAELDVSQALDVIKLIGVKLH